jgi:DNA-binding XRE family transcriptional regulator
MLHQRLLTEKDLPALAKHYRKKAGKARTQVGRELGVSHVSIFRAEEKPEESLLKLRLRMIEACSEFKVRGPVYLLEKK